MLHETLRCLYNCYLVITHLYSEYPKTNSKHTFWMQTLSSSCFLSTNLRDLFIEQLQILAQNASWSEGLPEIACSKLQLPHKYYYIWFSRGIKDILLFLEEKYDQEMLNSLNSMPAIQGVTNKINQALAIRICSISCSKDLSIKNRQYYSTSSNLPFASKIAWRTVDQIWRYAGDLSTDFNFYSKRALLQGVYLASQIKYHTDYSDDCFATKEFITKSLQSIVQGAKTFKQACSLLQKLPIIRMFV